MTKPRGLRASRPRPWRAIAYTPDPTAPNGRRRVVAGRVAAYTEDGLAAFIRRHRRAGNVVDRYRVTSFDEVMS